MSAVKQTLPEEERQRALWADIPIRTIVYPSVVAPSYTIAKSGVLLKDSTGDKFLITGNSASRSSERAQVVSRYEVLERVGSWYRQEEAFQRLSVVRWPNLQPLSKSCVFADVAIGPDPTGTRAYDASGLALGPSIEAAARHAVGELLERHRLASLWYHGLPLVRIGDTGEDLAVEGGDIRDIRAYTVADNYRTPFALVVLRMTQGALICGSKCAGDFAAAIDGAMQEAVMLADDVKREKGGSCISGLSGRRRLLSLRDSDVSKRRAEKIEALTRGEVSFNSLRLRGAVPADQVAAPFSGSEPDIEIVVIRNSPGQVVVRAISPAFKTLTTERRKQEDKYDPFC